MEKIQLTNSNGIQTTYWACRTDKALFFSTSGKRKDKTRERFRKFDSEEEATNHAKRMLKEKYDSGFVYIQDWDKAAFGSTIFKATVPDNSISNIFDLHPFESIIVFAAIRKFANGTTIYSLDLMTGKQTPILVIPHKLEDGTKRLTHIHSLHFSASGDDIYYTLNAQTYKLNIKEPVPQLIADCPEKMDHTNFNPFYLRPSQSSDRQRLVIIDNPGVAKVLGVDDRELFEKRFTSKTSECRYMALSPSGKYVAFLMMSRYIIYGHDRASNDETNEVEIWNVDTRTHHKTLTFKEKLEKIAFSPDDTQLLVNLELSQGPAIYNIESGQKEFHFPNEFRKDRWFTCFNWKHSYNGEYLVVGGFTPFLFDAKTNEGIGIEELSKQRVQTIIFDNDDRFVITGGDRGQIVVQSLMNREVED